MNPIVLRAVCASVGRSIRALLLLLLASALGYAHGPDPEVIRLSSSTGPGAGIYALTTNQGILAYLNFEYKWICEDAIYPFARTNALVIDEREPSRWLVATNYGLYISTDNGCDFSPVDHALARMKTVGLWQRPNGSRIIAAAEHADEGSMLFWSDDLGRTWQDFPVHVSGKVISVIWFGADHENILVHHSRGISVRESDGKLLRELTVTDGSLNIPFGFIGQIDISPTNQDIMLAVIQLVERSRILRTDDGGRRWQTVGLFDDPNVQVMLNGTDGRAIGVGQLGGRWSSDDSGVNWRIEPPGEPTIGCLYRRDLSDTIYACGNPYAGGPWAIGRSTDFGLTWTPVLTQVESATHRKDCTQADRTYLCCRGRCPGNQMSCGQPNSVMWPEMCYEDTERPIPDAGLLTDSALSVEGDAAGDVAGDNGGCNQTGRDGRHIPRDFLYLLMIASGAALLNRALACS